MRLASFGLSVELGGEIRLTSFGLPAIIGIDKEGGGDYMDYSQRGEQAA